MIIVYVFKSVDGALLCSSILMTEPAEHGSLYNVSYTLIVRCIHFRLTFDVHFQIILNLYMNIVLKTN